MKFKKNQKNKITQIVSPLPSPAAETLRRAHMSHALVTAVRDGEMCRRGISDGGVVVKNFPAVAAVEKPPAFIFSVVVLFSCCTNAV